MKTGAAEKLIANVVADNDNDDDAQISALPQTAPRDEASPDTETENRARKELAVFICIFATIGMLAATEAKGALYTLQESAPPDVVWIGGLIRLATFASYTLGAVALVAGFYGVVLPRMIVATVALVPMIAAALGIGILFAKLFVFVKELIDTAGGVFAYEKLGGDFEWLLALGLAGCGIIAALAAAFLLTEGLELFETASKPAKPFRLVPSPVEEAPPTPNIID